jgi:hypothetical protein
MLQVDVEGLFGLLLVSVTVVQVLTRSSRQDAPEVLLLEALS